MSEKNIPRHVGLILDGNRRFATRRALQPWKGHESGKQKVEELLQWCKELGILEVTVYAFSLQNFSRPKEEVDVLMRLFLEAAKDFATRDDADKERVRIRVIGRKYLLPEKVQEAIAELEEQTKDHEPYTFNVAMAYGGREEILDAVRLIAGEVRAGTLEPEAIDEEIISSHLNLSSEPDMIIRTSGEHRTSNFLVWQSWYSEWFFVDKLWPELEKEDFVACVEEFAARKRRFGK